MRSPPERQFASSCHRELTGFDPFADEFIEFRTIGEILPLFKAREPKPAA